jgi:imidazolonepropionase-like amidohydrolase
MIRPQMVRTFVLFLTVAGCAQAPDDSCEECTALTGGQIFDGTRGGMGTVIVEGRQIVKIVWGEAHVRTGRVLDVRGQTVLPGLADLHVHLPAAPGPYGFYPDSNLVLDHLQPMARSGVTSFLDLGSSQSLIFTVRDQLAKEAIPQAPHMLAAGPLLTPTGGHPCYAGEPPGDACLFVDEPAQVAAAMTQLLAGKPDVVKVVLEAGTPSRPLPRLRNDVLAEVVKQAAGLPVFAHVARRQDVLDGLDAGVRVFAHVPMDDLFTDEDCRRLKDAGATLIPTLAVADALDRVSSGHFDELGDPTLADDVDPQILRALGDPKALGRMTTPEYQAFAHSLFENGMANLTMCARAGVTVAAGTDAGNPGTFHGRSLARELALYVEAGLTPTAALVAATSAAGKLLHQPIGVLAVGAPSDLLVVDGDPLSDISAVGRVSRVLIRGIELDRDQLAHGRTRWAIQQDAAAGSVCVAPGECASGLACSIDGRCAAACQLPEDCAAGQTCFPSLEGDGACHAGDGCDLFLQDCVNGAACIFWGNSATGCWFAGSGTDGAPCSNSVGCARGFQCDYLAGKCRKLCDPAAPSCANCVDQSAQAGLAIGWCQ